MPDPAWEFVSHMHLISQTEDTEHSPLRCHGIVIVLYNHSAASSTVIRDE